jgi:hypothetical protein
VGLSAHGPPGAHLGKQLQQKPCTLIPMEITINLSDIFAEEDGNPGQSLNDLVKQKVIDNLTRRYSDRLKEQIESEALAAVRSEIQRIIQERSDSLMEDLMNASFVPVDIYGRPGNPTTLRNELINAIANECTFKSKSFNSDENLFTRTVKETIKKTLAGFKDEFLATVDSSFRKDALAYAVEQLRERLGLPR